MYDVLCFPWFYMTSSGSPMIDVLWFHMHDCLICLVSDLLWCAVFSFDFAWFLMIDYVFQRLHMICYDFMWCCLTISYNCCLLISYAWVHMISDDVCDNCWFNTCFHDFLFVFYALLLMMFMISYSFFWFHAPIMILYDCIWFLWCLMISY